MNIFTNLEWEGHFKNDAKARTLNISITLTIYKINSKILDIKLKQNWKNYLQHNKGLIYKVFRSIRKRQRPQQKIGKRHKHAIHKRTQKWPITFEKLFNLTSNQRRRMREHFPLLEKLDNRHPGRGGDQSACVYCGWEWSIQTAVNFSGELFGDVNQLKMSQPHDSSNPTQEFTIRG